MFIDRLDALPAHFSVCAIDVMDLKEIVLYFVVVCSSLAEAIRCKCTKESETVSCIDGVCEMEPGCEFFFSVNIAIPSVDLANPCGLSLYSPAVQALRFCLFGGAAAGHPFRFFFRLRHLC